ncbi:MAG: hypothetical protein GEU90_00570 [Gemmatimonas sp.]|nr:hypothetical protein [Gemmatimonas sp.]
MDFKQSMDALGITAEDAAELLDRPAQSIRQMRLDPDHRNYRPPPTDWRERLAQYARQRGGELASIANTLEQEDR